ncbi:adaptor protein MecA [Kurthia zopfii]|uniref:adaptor protein MecA n=1 Tax=Kurthia zopfii TaxID=1650 RepID=UPI000F6FE84C|nr:adaptor protein MecA [Kurthia zopfii]VEI04930.1 Adapter protein mecA 1 [Kurthia zopfii]
MDIERINENTIKLVISYKDIEERGFTKDEIWYNRDKGEELFWVMMDEVNDDQFEINGPLWIQVVAKDVGLELTVTIVTNPTEMLGAGMEDLQAKGNQFSNLFDVEPFNPNIPDFIEEEDVLVDEIVFEFKNFDDLIPLAKSAPEDFDLINELFEYEGKYYLYVDLHEIQDVEDQQDIISPILEYADESSKTIHVIREYGKLIMEGDCFRITREYF